MQRLIGISDQEVFIEALRFEIDHSREWFASNTTIESSFICFHSFMESK